MNGIDWTADFDNAEQAEDYAAFAYRLEQQAERKAAIAADFPTLEDLELSLSADFRSTNPQCRYPTLADYQKGEL